MTEPAVTRAALVSEVRARIGRESSPRLIVFTIVLLAGGCAFLTSALALSAGLHAMGVRYGLAALAGYGAFALLIRGWIAMRKGDWDLLADLPLPDVGPGGGRGPAAEAPRLFMGGRSGGGGTSGAWVEGAAGSTPGVVPVPVPAAAGADGGAAASGDEASRWLGKLDLEDGWKVVAALALVFGAVIAAGFVVYSAPLLLAEVAVDAGVMATVYRRVRRQELGHWTGAVLRRTWLPALVIIVSVAAAGFLLQAAVPDARSIGGVVRALAGR